MQESNVISLSGGKDSTALLLLAKEREIPNLKAVFADTGNEHPMTYEYIHYLEHATGISIQTVKANFTDDMRRKINFINSTWREQGIDNQICDKAIECLKPSGNPFLDLCLMKGIFPSPLRRFCTTELKRNPIFNDVLTPLLQQNINIELWQGVRAQESSARAKLTERDMVSCSTLAVEHWNYRPLLYWSVEDVFRQHKRHHIKPNPLYKLGMNRVGCMPCIFCGKKELLHIAMRFPEEIDRIVEWEALVSQVSKRGKVTFFPTNKGRGDGILENIQWSKTKRGSKEIDLENLAQTRLACSSNYGLCE